MPSLAKLNIPNHSKVSTNNFTMNSTYYYYYGSIVLLAENGYYFDENTTYTLYKESNPTASAVNGVISENGAKCTFTVYNNTAVANQYGNITTAQYTISGELASENVLPTPTELTLILNVSNVELSGVPNVVYNNTVLEITCEPSNGYEIINTPKLEFSETVLDYFGDLVYYVPFELVDGVWTLETDLAAYDLEYSGELPTLTIAANAVAIEIEPPEPQSVELIQSLINCGTNAPQFISSNDTALNVTATANVNCEFQTAPQLYILDANGNPHTQYFNVANDKLTATLNFDLQVWGGVENITRIEIVATAVVITEFADKYGNINVYEITEHNLQQFAGKRFFNENLAAQTDTPQYIAVDLANYVASVKRLYISGLTTVSDVLRVGNYNTNIAVKSVMNDNIIIDCGSVNIPNYSQSVNDYETTKITLFLPFVGFHDISNDYVGKTVNLRFSTF